MLRADWLVPEWPVHASVRAVFTSRSGGVSGLPYDSLNLGDHVGDRPADVLANRKLLQRATGARVVFLEQVHGCGVLALDAGSRDGQQADACLTTQRQLACTVMVADCLPVLLSTQSGDVVAAAHAGWRGLAGGGTRASAGQGAGVLEAVYASFSAVAKSQRPNHAIETIAWLGPCIGPTAFEVGAEVKAAFEAVVPGASRMFVAVRADDSAAAMAGDKYLANLQGLARLRLQALGITQIHGNDGSAAWCTVGNPSRFFSHRRDAGGGIVSKGPQSTGRMAACIWRG